MSFFGKLQSRKGGAISFASALAGAAIIWLGASHTLRTGPSQPQWAHFENSGTPRHSPVAFLDLAECVTAAEPELGAISPSAVILSANFRALRRVKAGSALFEIPAGAPIRLTVSAPGFEPAEIDVPSTPAAATFELTQPVSLTRKSGRLVLRSPAPELDYDSARIEWKEPLASETAAPPPAATLTVPLDFAGERTFRLSTGIYRLTLSNGKHARAPLFIAAQAATIAGDAALPLVIPLPRSVSGSYIGCAGFTSTSPEESNPVAFLCGIRIDMRRNSGEFLVDYRSVKKDQTFEFAALRPRPDSIYPITNLYLEDPARVSFDCPISHADHRVVIDSADGSCFFQAKLLSPQDEPELNVMLRRMRELLSGQARRSAGAPEAFDPLFAKLPEKQLPNFQLLLSRESYSRHLTRLAAAGSSPVDLGKRLTVRRTASGWTSSITPAAAPPEWKQTPARIEAAAALPARGK